jgi:hypothetical protein
MDMGAYVVVLNAEKVVVSGNKFETKMYRRHTGRPGSLKEETFKKLQAVRPCSCVCPLRSKGCSVLPAHVCCADLALLAGKWFGPLLPVSQASLLQG